MIRTRLLSVAVSAVLVTGWLTAGSPHANAYVDTAVTAEIAAGGTADVLVYLAGTADLSGAATLDTKPARAGHVYRRLTATAAASQADLRATLAERAIRYTSFWIANALRLEADRALLDELAARPDVARIEPNRTYPLVEPVAGFTPAAAAQAVERGITNINADQVWSLGFTGQDIVVANIDTGVQFDHPGLVDQYRGTATGSHDYNWFDPTGVCPPSNPCDSAGHGTHTMGTMVGDDGAGNQVGVAPGAQWIAAKGCESNACTSASLLAAGQWMLAPTDLNGGNPDPSMAPDVVNNSWAGGHGDTWYQATIEAWISAGIFPMFAAGNNGPACATVSSPADNVPAYGIAAYDITDTLAGFSGRGASGVSASLVKPDLAAPGVTIRSTYPTSEYAFASGTSMAAPHASGVVALLWSAQPALLGDVAATAAILDQSGRDVNDTSCGGTADNNNSFGEGRLDALAAVTAAL